MPRTMKPEQAGGRLGVIDIGSNSIRLVIFAGAVRALQAVFNEKVLCGLGRGLDETGRLNKEGIALAIENLARFAAVAEAMGAERLEAFATAAVRDAADGEAFLRTVTERCGFPVRLLSGADEACISALGVISAIPEADGIIGDLGGGSLELVSVQDGAVGAHATLPLGPFRLMREGELGRITGMIDRHLDTLPWLGRLDGRSFYPVGGNWRALARVHMNHYDYPLHVIHHYALGSRQVAELANLIGRQTRKSLNRLKGAPKRRLDTLPYGALLMQRLLVRVRPKQVVFSAYGLREGFVYDMLPPVERARDPLVEACAEVARGDGRFAPDGEALFAWMAPLFAAGSPVEPRLRLAACWLGDIAGLDHPDYRGEHAFLRVLRLPVVGIDHPGRAFLALALLARYEGDLDAPFAAIARRLVTPDQLHSARVTGLALRLAFALSAGSTDRLKRTELRLEGDAVSLAVPPDATGFTGEVVRRRFDALARSVGRDRSFIDAA